VNVVVAAGEEMPEFMREKNGEQRNCERQTGEQGGRMLVEKRVGMEKLRDGCGLLLRESDGKLRTRRQRGAQREQKQGDGQQQTFSRGARKRRTIHVRGRGNPRGLRRNRRPKKGRRQGAQRRRPGHVAEWGTIQYNTTMPNALDGAATAGIYRVPAKVTRGKE
jgi:hypothetical protein